MRKSHEACDNMFDVDDVAAVAELQKVAMAVWPAQGFFPCKVQRNLQGNLQSSGDTCDA